MHPSVRNRLGNRPRFEYVNRAGQQVNPRTGNPYKRPPNNPSGRLTRQPEVTNKTPKTLPVRTTGAMFGGLEPIPTDPTIDPPPWACFNCWQKGHSRRNCPMPCTALLCHNCGRRGEQVSTCPRCWRVHREYVIKLSELRAKGKIYSDVEELLASVDGNDACDEVLRELILQNEMNKRPTQSMDRRNPTHHERHTGLTFFQEFENSTHNRFNNSQFHEQELEETELEDDSYAVENRLLSRESIDQSNGQESPEWRKYDRTSREEEPSQSSSIDVGDPVQDILSLAKSISHLSADTQDLIMRQVMAERKELARLRALREEHIKVKEDHW